MKFFWGRVIYSGTRGGSDPWSSQLELSIKAPTRDDNIVIASYRNTEDLVVTHLKHRFEVVKISLLAQEWQNREKLESAIAECLFASDANRKLAEPSSV